MKKGFYIVAFISFLYFIMCLLSAKHFEVACNVSAKAKQDDAFAQVASFRNWKNWSIWFNHDKTVHVTFSGPETHVGAAMQWESAEFGNGEIYITDFEPYRFVRQKMIFKKFDSEFISEFYFEEKSESTEVKWLMKKELGFLERPFGFVYAKSMKKDMEPSLQKLRSLIETRG